MSLRAIGSTATLVSGVGVPDTPVGGLFGSAYTFAIASRTQAALVGRLTVDTTITLTGLPSDRGSGMILVQQDAVGGHSLTLAFAGATLLLDEEVNTDPLTWSQILFETVSGTDVVVAVATTENFESTYVDFEDKTASYALAGTDHNKTIRWDSGSLCDATFNADTLSSGWSAQLVCKGTGGVRLVPGAGVTLIPEEMRYIGQHRGLFATCQPEANTIRLEVGPEGVPVVVAFTPYSTAGRPSAVTSGAGGAYYDTTLHKPAWSDGTVWRDAAGTSV